MRCYHTTKEVEGAICFTPYLLIRQHGNVPLVDNVTHLGCAWPILCALFLDIFFEMSRRCDPIWAWLSKKNTLYNLRSGITIV